MGIFDKDNESSDVKEGAKDGRKEAKEWEKHPIAGPASHALFDPLQKAGKSEEYINAYNRELYGEAIANVMHSERHLFDTGNDEDEESEDYEESYSSESSDDRSYTTRDKDDWKSGTEIRESQEEQDKGIWEAGQLLNEYRKRLARMPQGRYAGRNPRAELKSEIKRLEKIVGEDSSNAKKVALGLLGLVFAGGLIFAVVGGITETKEEARKNNTKIQKRLESQAEKYEYVIPKQIEKPISLEDRVKANLKNWLDRNKYAISEFGKLGYGFDIDIKDLKIIEEDVWAIGHYAPGGHGKILHSNDKGKNWEVQLNGSFNSSNPFKVEFLDKYRGWVATNNSVLYTANGGKLWQEYKFPPTPNPKNGLLIYWTIKDFKIIGENHLQIFFYNGATYNLIFREQFR